MSNPVTADDGLRGWDGRTVTFVVSSELRASRGDEGALREVMKGISIASEAASFSIRPILKVEGVEAVLPLANFQDMDALWTAAHSLLGKFPLTETDPLVIIRHAFAPFVQTGWRA